MKNWRENFGINQEAAAGCLEIAKGGEVSRNESMNGLEGKLTQVKGSKAQPDTFSGMLSSFRHSAASCLVGKK